MSQSIWHGSQEAVEERVILSLPGASHAPSLPPETLVIICSFYESDDISRVMPGKKNFVSVKEGKRQHIQKPLVLNNLREVYDEFKEKFPDCKIGLSKFGELISKHCVLTGASGTHSVCVSTIHQNVKLMSSVQEIQIPELQVYQRTTTVWRR